VPAFSQEIGDTELGRQYTEETCSSCHAVHAHEIDSRFEHATPFQIVAEASGMTANALTAWLQTSHPTIPNIIMMRGVFWRSIQDCSTNTQPTEEFGPKCGAFVALPAALINAHKFSERWDRSIHIKLLLQF
jgi:hypothetical protein